MKGNEMKRAAFCLLVLLLSSVDPIPAMAEDGWSGTCSVDVWSKYLGWTDTVANHDPAFQPNCTVTEPLSGMFAGFWGTFSLPAAFNSGTINSQHGQQLNYYLGWSRTYGDWTVLAQFAYWDLVPLLGTALDRGELAVRVENKVYHSENLDLYAYGKARWLIFWENIHPEIDTALGFRAKYVLMDSLFFNDDALSLSPFVEVVRDDGGGYKGVDSGFLWHTGGSVNWDVTKSVTIRPIQLRAEGPISDYNHKGVEVVIGTGVTVKW